MTINDRTRKLLALVVAACIVCLPGCGSSESGEMSDQQKIDAMKKAHDTPIGPSPTGAATAGAPASTTGQ